jgi:hypothetical protein
MTEKTTANTPPTIEGFAKAWRIDMEAVRAKLGTNNDDATVASWIVYAPWSHPFWPYVLIAAVHLRDLPGQSKPPTVHLAGATHEIFVVAMNPDNYPPKIGDFNQLLSPINFSGQWIAASDEDAANRVEATVREICEGKLNPDTDATQQWVARFGDHCFKAEYKNAKPGSVEHALMQGGSVIISEQPDGTKTAIHLHPGDLDTPPTETKQ